MHIVVVDPTMSEIVFAKVFDTYESSYYFDSFVQTEIPEGHIVIAACKDDCTKNLSTNGKKFFSDMGSKEIWTLGYR